MTRVDHIGIAVRSIAQAQRLYDSLNLTSSPIEEIAQEGVRISRIGCSAQGTGSQLNTRRTAAQSAGIELLEPMGENSSLERFLSRRGEGLHHIALQVDNIAEVLERVIENGLHVVSEGIRVSPSGYRYFFIHPAGAGGVLIEICQASAGDDLQAE